MAWQADPGRPLSSIGLQITGFLGAGKSTLINRLLGASGLLDALVIINEFDTIGLDQLFHEEIADDVALMASGCLCCNLRDLNSTAPVIDRQAQAFARDRSRG